MILSSYLIWSLVLLLIFMGFFFVGLECVLLDTYYIIEYVMITFHLLEVKMFMYFDWMSCFFVAGVMLISSMVLIYSEEYMKEDVNSSLFLLLVLMFIFSMMLLIVCLNLFTMMMGWDGLGMISYCLVIYYQNEVSQNAGVLTIMINKLGDIGMVLGIILMGMMGSWDFLGFKYIYMLNIYGVFIFMGALTKSAQMPFSAWLPAAMAAPTPVSALVHSSTLVTAGVYLLLRFEVVFSGGSFSNFLFYVSLMTMFMSGLNANFEFDLKKIIALSTLSQLGMMFMVVSVGMMDFVFFHLLSHAIFKSMLFLCAGVIIHSLGGFQDIRGIMGVQLSAPMINGCLILASLSLSGFPFLCGFYSKDLIIEYLYMQNMNIFLMLMLMSSVMFTMMYSIRMIYYCSWKKWVKSCYILEYNNSCYYSFSILLLSCFVVFFGAFYFWMCFHSFELIYLVFSLKILNIYLIFLALFLGGVLIKLECDGGFIFSGVLFLGGFNYFLSKMWFLSSFVGSFSLFFLSYVYKNLKFVEMGWMEVNTVNSVILGLNSVEKSVGVSYFLLRELFQLILVFYMLVLIMM